MLKQKILILGMGLSGQAAARFLLQKDALVYCFDENKSLLLQNEAILNLQKNGLLLFDDQIPFSSYRFDLVVLSPGFSLRHELYLKAVQDQVEIIGEIELGARYVKNRCIGITGTNGKTTVTLLVEHILNYAGTSALAVGNVGKPLTSYLLENPNDKDVLVIELSSYQIETLSSKVFDVAVILNITPDHLDRYVKMSEYAKAKIKLEHNLKKNGCLYVNDKCYEEFKSIFQTSDIKLFGDGCFCEVRTDLENVYLKEKFEYKLPCEIRGFLTHEVENMMAAYAIVKHFNVTNEQFLEAYLSFKKPPHRIEFVREVKSVAYYDDSKGTNIDAVIKAVTSLKTPLYLIAGGVDKGASYQPWKKFFNGKVKAVFAIGQAAKIIKRDLSPDVNVEIFDTLESAVRKAASEAKSGESVLLSPGCSSFDMFKDYKERGDEFKKVVKSL